MGQYHIIVNLDKKETFSHYELGAGAKLREQAYTDTYTTAIMALLAASSGRGGGDFHDDEQVIGRWAGDRIAILGDYCEPDDLVDEYADEVYRSASNLEDGWTDISELVVPFICSEMNVRFTGSGWKRIEELR